MKKVRQFLTRELMAVRPMESVTLALVAVLLATSGIVVYMTGGSRYVYAHTMYVPIIVAAACFGLRGAIPAAMVGGLILGPLMPLDTATGEAQLLVNWMLRLAMFTFVGTVLGIVMDAFRHAIADLTYIAENDPAIGLPNRTGFLSRLTSIIATEPARLSVIFMEIESFVDIYYAFGPGCREECLDALVMRMKSMLPPQATLAFLQTRYFAIALTESASIAQDYAAMIVSAFQSDSVYIQGIPTYVEMSYGIAEYPGHANSASDLLHKAGIAMHARKRDLFAPQAYVTSRDWTSKQRIALLGAVPRALEEGQFVLHYQPRYHLQTGQIESMEALLRWNHPQEGLLYPGAFLPAIEKTALMYMVTKWVLSSALTQARQWHGEGYEISVSVNVSSRDLGQRDLVSFIEEQLAAHAVPPAMLELEITETSTISPSGETEQMLRQLGALGVKISLDDFGTGHTSLDRIHDLPINAIKIDRSFVTGIDTDFRAQAIVSAALAIADNLGIYTIAEGIETAGVIETLKELGCQMGQGFYMSRPLPAEETIALLIKSKPF